MNLLPYFIVVAGLLEVSSIVIPSVCQDPIRLPNAEYKLYVGGRGSTNTRTVRSADSSDESSSSSSSSSSRIRRYKWYESRQESWQESWQNSHSFGSSVYENSAEANTENAFMYATYTCNQGYRRASGNRQMYCYSDGWDNRNVLRCQSLRTNGRRRRPRPGSCRSLEDIPGATFVLSTRGTVTTAIYSCIDGYRRQSGANRRTCIRGCCRRWRPIRCMPIRAECPKLTLNRFSTVRLCPDGFDTYADFSCSRGYRRDKGAYSARCSTGIWEEFEPLECVPPECPPPAYIRATTVRLVPRSDGAVLAAYECIGGYRYVQGQTERLCERGVWKSWRRPITCLRKKAGSDCPAPPRAANSIVTLVAVGGVKQANYACKNGFDSVSGQFNILCSDGTNWDTNDALRCRDSVDVPVNGQCPPPPLGVNVVLTGRSGDSGTEQTALYKCKDGFVFKDGSAAISCVNGRWLSQNMLTCMLASIANEPGSRRNDSPSIDRVDP